MSYFRIMPVILLAATLAFSACDDGGGGGGTNDIAVTFLSAAQTGGTSGTTESTGLTLTFDVDPTTLTADDITVTGASKGLLSGTGTTRSLAISDITIANGATVSVTITSPAKYAISGSPQTAVVYRIIAGSNLIYTLPSSIVFNMKYVPGGTFPTGLNDDGTATVDNPYWLAETEVTYELWYAVRTWARSNGYTLNANPGREGNDGTITSGTGETPTAASQEPVTTINWREAMVWCNALTEYYNANNGTDPDLDCVYYTNSDFTTPIRTANDTGSVGSTAGGQDDPYVKSTAKGFRLPIGIEWECAARYQDGSIWTPGSWASRGTGAYTGTNAIDYPNFDSVAWYGNSISSPDGNTTSTQPVGQKTENLLGIHDMSGNVWELCFDWDPVYEGTYRRVRGGGWNSVAGNLRIGYPSNHVNPFDEGNIVGFRFARSAP